MFMLGHNQPTFLNAAEQSRTNQMIHRPPINPDSTKSTPSTSNSPRKLNIFLHNGNPLGMNGAQIGILEKMDKEGFGGFLKSLNCLRLPAHTFALRTIIKSNFSDLYTLVLNVSPLTSVDIPDVRMVASEAEDLSTAGIF
jgi:hypothetical protein